MNDPLDILESFPAEDRSMEFCPKQNPTARGRLAFVVTALAVRFPILNKLKAKYPMGLKVPCACDQPCKAYKIISGEKGE